MKITICGSMVFSAEMVKTKEILEEAGHTVFVSKLISRYLGNTIEAVEKLAHQDKVEFDRIRGFCKYIQESDAILVLNYDKRGIKNYIGGNTLIEMGYAHIINKKIFLLNQIPDIEYYKSEIEAVKPVILNGDLNKVMVGVR
jgi:hypothetical protein